MSLNFYIYMMVDVFGFEFFNLGLEGFIVSNKLNIYFEVFGYFFTTSPTKPYRRVYVILV